MLKPSPIKFHARSTTRMSQVLIISIVACFTASALPATAQTSDFQLTTLVELHPVNFGGSSTAVLSLQALDSAGQTEAVAFTCSVTPVETAGTPGCSVSPTPQIPGAQGAQILVTVTTSSTTPPGAYQITVTGTSTSTTANVTLSLGVTPLSEDYTLSVLPSPATPNPVKAGSAATTTVTVAPIGSYSGHTITLSCLTVSPTVLLAPVCSFSPASVTVTGGALPTSILSITTAGPPPSAVLKSRRVFYTLLLLLPGLGVIGCFSSGRNKYFGRALFLVTVACSLFFLPSCSSSSSTTSTSSANSTPKNTYTFTLSGADENGAAPSNITTSPATVTVTVD